MSPPPQDQPAAPGVAQDEAPAGAVWTWAPPLHQLFTRLALASLPSPTPLDKSRTILYIQNLFLQVNQNLLIVMVRKELS